MSYKSSTILNKTIIFTLPTLLLSISPLLRRSWSNAIVQFVNQFFKLKSFNFETESIFLILLMSETMAFLISFPKSIHLVINFLLFFTCFFFCLCLYCYNCHHHYYHYHHLIIECIETWAGNLVSWSIILLAMRVL